MPHTRPQQPRRHLRPARILAVTVATLALAGGGVAQAAPAGSPGDSGATPLVDLVNPFIGTQDEGNTYPGAAMPFGMVQFSPDNGHNVGYDYTRTSIQGFSLVHISGVGCTLGGIQPMLPTVGDVTRTDKDAYALGYSHEAESASAGHYSVDLGTPAGAISAELTATPRTGVARYTFPSTDRATVLINTGQALNTVVRSSVSVVDARTVDATITTKGFCQDTPEVTFHTRTVFDRDVVAAGTWSGDTVSDAQHSEGTGRRGSWVRFDTTDGDLDVEAQTSLSYVDAEGAAANLEAERATYDEALSRARETWEERLHSIEVTGGDRTTRAVFYSSLYRSLLAPNIGSDVDGRYTGWDQAVHEEEDPDFTYYQNYSLWDTYRTQEQLVALLDPDTAADQALSLVRQGQQYGWLPRWGYATVETNIMTGDPGTSWLVSAWAQGLLKGHEEETYQLLLQNADGVPPADWFANGRAGNVEYIRDGYVPQDPSTRKTSGDYDLDHGGSATLEYALADAGLSTMARALGHEEDADRLAARGTSYRNIFDPSTGYFRARDRSGAFVGSEDPTQALGFHEATPVQYTWLVQQNPYDLMDLLGGRQATLERLDHFFAFPEVVSDPAGTARNRWVTGTYDYYGFDTYNPNNEPDFHAPYMYLWAGQPSRTTDVLRAARTLFSDGPTGVTGNDDLGTMSAWYVFASIGLFPIVPGQDVWGISTPAFESVTVQRPDGKPLELSAPGLSDSARYIQDVSMDGASWDRGYVEDSDLDGVGTVTFAVGTTPSDWATGEDAAPAPMVTADLTQSRLSVSAAQGRWAAPGTSFTLGATVVAQGAGTVSGTLAASADGVGVRAVDPQWSVTSNGLPATARVDLAVDVPAWATYGEHVLTLTAQTDGSRASATVPVQVGPPSVLEAEFTEKAIGTIGSADADFDGLGYFYDRSLLGAAGIGAGTLETVPGTDLTYWIQGRAGAKDNLRMAGQAIALPAALASSSRIALVGASNNGTFSGELRLGLRDTVSGATSTVSRSVTMPDWCSGDRPGGGATALAITSARGSRTGSDGARCGLYSTAVLDVPEGKELVSLTLPDTADSRKMHLFAIASDAPVWQETTTTATVSAPKVQRGEPVTVTVGVTPVGVAGRVLVYEGDQQLAEATIGTGGDSSDHRIPVDGLSTGGHGLRAVFVPTDAVAYSGSSAEPVTVEVTDGSGTGDPTDPADPADPTDPAEPTDPGDPADPGEPDGSEQSGTVPTPVSSSSPEGTDLAHTGFGSTTVAAVTLIGLLGLMTTTATRLTVARRTRDGRSGR